MPGFKKYFACFLFSFYGFTENHFFGLNGGKPYEKSSCVFNGAAAFTDGAAV